MPKMIIVERCDGTCKRVHKADINYKEVYCVLLRKYVDPSTLHPDCPLDDAPVFAYKVIEEIEEILGYKVNDVFRNGWCMARTTNAMLGISEPEEKGGD